MLMRNVDILMNIMNEFEIIKIQDVMNLNFYVKT